jgi:hypothetical protein
MSEYKPGIGLRVIVDAVTVLAQRSMISMRIGVKILIEQVDVDGHRTSFPMMFNR